MLYFNIIPNTVLENNINCKTANDFFIDKYKNEFKEKFYIKATYDDETKSSLKEVYYVLDGVMIVFFVILVRLWREIIAVYFAGSPKYFYILRLNYLLAQKEA